MKLTKNLAYIAGALRDGSVLRYKEKSGKMHYYTTVYNKDEKWLRELQKLFEKEFGIRPKLRKQKNRASYIRTYNKGVAKYFEENFEHPLKNQIGWKTPNLIRKCTSKKILVNYIAGFWDAEGGFDIRTRQIRFHLSAKGKKCLPLEDMKNFLEKFGIECGKVGRYKNERGVHPRFVLRVLKSSNKKFLNKIPLKSFIKKNKINKFAGISRKTAHLPRSTAPKI